MPEQMSLSPSAVIPPGKRVEDFRSTYANSARFEPTVYDLKIVFGQTDLSGGIETVEQDTAVTIPWPLAKLAIYYLKVQLGFHEAGHGTVAIPPSQIPPYPPDPPADQSENPVLLTGVDTARKAHKELIDSL